MKIGIIDLGTNTFNLLIAEIDDIGGYQHLYKSKVGVKLGEGSFEKNYITEEAMERAMVALTAQIAAIKNQHCDRILAFATSAVRNASNGQQFVDKVYDHFKIRIRVIDGEEEASMIYRGVQLSEVLTENNSVIMDIGGGSTEFIIANDQEIIWKKSYELGVTRLIEKFKPSDPVTKSEIKSIEKYIKSQIGEVFENLHEEKVHWLVGSSGSFETFSDILSFRRDTYPADSSRSALNMPIHDLSVLLKEIIASDRSKRQAMRGMAAIRVDFIVISAIFVNMLLKNSDLNEGALSRYALKEGVLFDVLKGNL